MGVRTIDGKCFTDMLVCGASVLSAHTAELNSLNVFPVADGDTGTNMLRTMEGGLAGLRETDTADIGELADRFTRHVLLSARGNSGVILSQIFGGINEGLAGHACVTATQLADAYRQGIVKSYAAVQNPTEGTILTVFRESTEYAADRVDDTSSVEDFYRLHLDAARESLSRTKDLLPVLAESDVVDSGAAGYLCIAEGMYMALTGQATADLMDQPVTEDKTPVNIDLFTRDSVLTFGYCTECMLRLTTAKVDPDRFDIGTVIDLLKELGGESIVAYRTDDLVKVHVHTFTPGDVLARLQAFGEFLTVKIENMSLGHTEVQRPAPKPQTQPKKKFSVVAVASGDGMAALFTHMGAEHIVSGGQTANPSIEELVAAFEACEAEHILVLPNNGNVILAARQAASLYTGADVRVIPTHSFMEGYSALSVMTPGITDMDALERSAVRAAESVQGCEITRAVRDTVLEGVEVHVGDYLALGNGRMMAKAPTPEDAVEAALTHMDVDLCEIITLFVGKQVGEDQRVALTERLETAYPDLEITVYDGGQEVYDYLVAVE